MHKAFSYDEAADIAEDFMDLEGTGIFIETDEMTVACNVALVVVAPYPSADRELFIETYKSSKDHATALEAYSGTEYEVLILGSNADSDSDELVIITIGVYTTAYGIPYKYP